MDIQAGQELFLQARRAIEKGNPEQALPLLKNFLSDCREDWEVRLELARALYLSGRVDSARSELETLTETEQAPEVWRSLGAVLGQLGLLREESEAYRKAPGSSPEVLFNLGLQAAERKDEKALRAIRDQLVQLQGEQAEGDWLTGILGELREDLDAALTAYRSARKRGTRDWQLDYNIARCVLALGRPREAEDELARARDSGGERWELLLLQGSICRDLEDLPGAQAALEKAVSLAPEGEPLPAFQLAMLLLEEGDPGAASGYFNRASLAAPDDKEIRLSLARARFSARRYAQAAEVYREIVADDPGHFRALYNLAYSLERIDSLEEAKATYEKALARRPGHYKTMNKLARLHLKEGDYERARHLAEKGLLQEHEENAEGYLFLGQALKSQGKLLEASQSLQECVRREPGTSAAWKELAFCQRQLDQAGEAKESAKRAYSLSPRDSDVLIELGLAYLELGGPENLSKSRKAFQELLDKSSKNPKALAGLAQVSVLQDTPEEAHRHAIRAVEGKGGYRAYAALGSSYLRLRKPAKAIEAFKRCLGRNKSYAPACEGISEAYRDLGDSAKEEKYRQLAIRLRTRKEDLQAGEVTALVSLTQVPSGGSSSD